MGVNCGMKRHSFEKNLEKKRKEEQEEYDYDYDEEVDNKEDEEPPKEVN